jgi:autophagy-related protein 9
LAATYPSLGLEKLDAHSIAHRILRKENYMIALFNKEIMDLRIPYIGKRHLLTKIMEWNLWLCMATYVFGDNGQVKPMFLNERYR